MEEQGQSSTIKPEHLVAGHLEVLNGKYKPRVTELRHAPADSSASTTMPAPESAA
jgi:hypothetical protein